MPTQDNTLSTSAAAADYDAYRSRNGPAGHRGGRIMKRITSILAIILAAFIIYIGLSYLIAPQTTAPNLGIPEAELGTGEAFLNVKGVRDIVTGLVVLTVLFLRQWRVLGWLLPVIALIPLGDMFIVLGYSGPPAAAYGIHGATALVIALTGLLALRTAKPVSP